VQAVASSEPFKQLRARILGTVENEDEGAGADESSVDGSSDRTGLVSAVADHVEKTGGSTVFLFQFLRFVLVLALLALSIYSFVREEEEQQQQSGLLPENTLSSAGKYPRKKHRSKHRQDGDTLSEREWIDLAFCLDYVRGLSPPSFSLGHINRARPV
jgi:hypothetical protein